MKDPHKIFVTLKEESPEMDTSHKALGREV
jgi:hypothetical protein